MARAKKEPVIELEEIEEFDPEESEPEPAPVPVKQVKNLLRQEWIETVPVTPPPVAPAVDGQTVMIEEPDPSEPQAPRVAPSDPIQMRVDEIRAQRGFQWSMTVYRLPNYDRDFNSSLKARRILCGSDHFDADTFEETIQRNWARPGRCNTYNVQVRKNNRIYCELSPVIVEPVEEPPPAYAPAPGVPGQLVPLDPLQQMRETMKFMAELQRTMMPFFQPPAAQQPIGEISTEAALLKLIEQSPEQIARVTEKFFPSSSSAKDGESWLSIIQTMLPTLQPLLGALVQRLTTPAAPAPETAANATIDALPVDQPIKEPSIIEEKYLYIVTRILQGIDNGLAADFVGEEIDMVLAQVPELAPTIQNFMAVPPSQVLHTLAGVFPQAQKICQQPTAEQWIKDLQDYWSDLAPDDETTTLEQLK